MPKHCAHYKSFDIWCIALNWYLSTALFQYLDEYMECIEELSKDDSLGLTAINFVQAGLMVEQTTKVYALNVDYLWHFMTEVLEVLRMSK
jgi:hypothetical protein